MALQRPAAQDAEYDMQGYARTYIVVPSVVFALATGKLVDAGIMNRHSMLAPLLLKAGLDRGQAGVTGEGKNLWPAVELNESAYSQGKYR